MQIYVYIYNCCKQHSWFNAKELGAVEGTIRQTSTRRDSVCAVLLEQSAMIFRSVAMNLASRTAGDDEFANSTTSTKTWFTAECFLKKIRRIVLNQVRNQISSEILILKNSLKINNLFIGKKVSSLKIAFRPKYIYLAFCSLHKLCHTFLQVSRKI